MPYRKCYTLETQEGEQKLICDTADDADALNTLRAQRDSAYTDIPNNSKIYSYDVDESQETPELKVCNKTFIE